MTNYTLFYVLNGLVNGQKDEYALTAGTEEQLEDGHYFLPDDGDGSVDGIGPYDSVEEAEEAAKAELGPWFYSFPTDDRTLPRRMPRLISEIFVGTPLADDNVAKIERLENGRYRASIQGSYETLTLEMTCGSVDAIVATYAALLEVSHRYQ